MNNLTNNLKFGLEKEYFLANEKDELVVVPRELPKDDCGYLVEARGEACNTIEQAVFSLLAEEYRIKKITEGLGLKLIEKPTAKLPQNIKNKIRRTYIKGLVSYQNIYGHEHHRTKDATAGIHLSITSPQHYSKMDAGYTPPRTINKEYFAMFDWLQIFKKLDKEYATEIKEAKRNKGFYELKNDGRIEYRSLPNTVGLTTIIDTVNKILNSTD